MNGDNNKNRNQNNNLDIYLDIDGVLLLDGTDYAPKYGEEFLNYILDHYPNTTYWLTTHCWQNENRTTTALSKAYSSETLEKLKRIKPTNWDNAKTDAIDFSRKFLWFDDDMYDEEREALKQHNALQGHVMLNLYNNPDQLRDVLMWIETLRWLNILTG